MTLFIVPAMYSFIATNLKNKKEIK
jgi:hypothetical protein